MIHLDNSMNTNDLLQNRPDNQTRMRPYSNPYMHNYYPLNIGMPPWYNYQPQVVLNSNGGYTMVNNITESSSDNSGFLSPSSDTSIDRPLYRISTWQEIADKYDGSEVRPRCGRLINNIYFTQRATSSDVYMLFDKKSDYINNFVNYYFSDKNLARDQKLVALMDDKGIIPLSALIKFPKLHQIDSSIDDMIKAFQSNAVVMCVDINGEKGAQRRDKWCPLNPNVNVLESAAVTTATTVATITDGFNDNNNIIISEQSQSILQNDNIQSQPNQQLYYPQIYAQPPGMMPNSANINSLASFSPYTFLPMNTSFQSHQTNQVGLNTPQNQPTVVWQIFSQDYGNQNIIQPMPINRFSATNLEAPGNR